MNLQLLCNVNGIIIGINLGILIKKHGVYFDFSVQAKEKNNY